jgi:hypothetical protein
MLDDPPLIINKPVPAGFVIIRYPSLAVEKLIKKCDRISYNPSKRYLTVETSIINREKAIFSSTVDDSLCAFPSITPVR